MALQTKSIGALLVEGGVLTAEQVEAAQKDRQEKGGSLAMAAVRLGFCSEDAIAKHVAKQRGVKYVDVNAYIGSFKPEVWEQLVKLVSPDLANKHKAIPVGKRFDKFTFAVVDPQAPALIRFPDEFFRGKKGEVEFVVGTETMIEGALEQYFPQAKPAAADDGASGEMGAIQLADGLGGDVDIGDVEVVDEAVDTDADGAVDDAPVIRWVNKIIYDAVERKVSDIHLDPNEQGIMLRYRIDGVLVDIQQVPRNLRRVIPAVVKVKTKKMKIEEKRIPQDAKISIKVPGRERSIDLRVSTLPVMWGEKVVMRILDAAKLMTLNELGMESDELEKLEKAIRAPQGMIVVTGPTGSGKTNTLYSALNTINTRDTNIITAENPVEFQLPGINQVQIAPEFGMTFAAALKAFLRQDPDIVLVGEVRDYEEADIAIKMGMTGQLVLTTLHTNDAPTTISRLMDMRDPNGAAIDPGVLATTLKVVLAQRLMRRICQGCKKPVTYEAAELASLGLKPEEFESAELFRGEGCSKCGKSGYKGRVGIYEMMEITRALGDLIIQRKDSNVLRDQALKDGMRTLRQSAIRKVKAGLSTVEEIAEATIE